MADYLADRDNVCKACGRAHGRHSNGCINSTERSGPHLHFEAPPHEQGMSVYFQAGVRDLLRATGTDPASPGLAATPERLWKALLEIATPSGPPPDKLLTVTFGDVDYPSDQMVAVGPVPFTSLCEHHLLPFTGTAWIAYIPGAGGVVGLSKLPRLLDWFASRPQVQERLTSQVAHALEEHLQPVGAACVVRATHSCMSLRGVKKEGASMVTSVLLGAFKDNPTTRNEFMELTR